MCSCRGCVVLFTVFWYVFVICGGWYVSTSKRNDVHELLYVNCECGGTTEPAPGAPARRRRPRRRRERCATAIAPREEATEPTTTRRSASRRALRTVQRASRRRGRAAAERHAAASAAAQLSWRQERQRGAAGSGAVTRNQPGVRRPKVIDSKCL